ncbi:glycoside hydrolase family 3 [bacterium]|nr:glycoside hydrolase family 3 [bacterium]
MKRRFTRFPLKGGAKRILLLTIFLSVIAATTQQRACAQSPDDSLDIKIGQMLMVGFRGLTARPSSSIAEAIHDYHLGGVVLFDFDVEKKEYGRNITSPMQMLDLTSDLQQASALPLFIAVDQEGGKVTRMKTRDGFPGNVSQAYIGRIDNADSTTYYTDIMARSIRIVGANVNFAPVVDLNVNPSNPVIGSLGRSISSDPDVVSRNAALMIEAYHKWGVLCAVKHFPGHGSSMDDSHEGFVDVSDSWSDEELEPYRALVAKGLPDMVMTAHIYNSDLDETWPATLSKNVITGLLRDDIGYDGVVITDDLMMKAITDDYGTETAIKQAVLAGADILLFANNSYSYDHTIAKTAFSMLKALVEKGAISRERINQSYLRIMRLKNRLMPGRAER